ncbi:unnamed protein product [Soboliphyme baturini]|uniref:Transposase n=1 Tax=Soboliphyme baturini TaxID=241478 RepID=A0A183ILV8_9BILA|nr:unnamed protein product [Soboliphyme baturini]
MNVVASICEPRTTVGETFAFMGLKPDGMGVDWVGEKSVGRKPSKASNGSVQRKHFKGADLSSVHQTPAISVTWAPYAAKAELLPLYRTVQAGRRYKGPNSAHLQKNALKHTGMFAAKSLTHHSPVIVYDHFKAIVTVIVIETDQPVEATQ